MEKLAVYDGSKWESLEEATVNNAVAYTGSAMSYTDATGKADMLEVVEACENVLDVERGTLVACFVGISD